MDRRLDQLDYLPHCVSQPVALSDAQWTDWRIHCRSAQSLPWKTGRNFRHWYHPRRYAYRIRICPNVGTAFRHPVHYGHWYRGKKCDRTYLFVRTSSSSYSWRPSDVLAIMGRRWNLPRLFGKRDR
jgi:hypothetical protein